MKVYKPKSSYAAKRDGDWQPILDEIASLPDPEAVAAWRDDFIRNRLQLLPIEWGEPVFDALEWRITECLNEEMDETFRQIMGGIL